ncbi:MAG: hypothetical protein PVTTEEND_001707 [Candidatus Fervidibacter sp.]
MQCQVIGSALDTALRFLSAATVGARTTLPILSHILFDAPTGPLRMAATILTRDPLFDWFAYGGALTIAADEFAIIPRDGLRKRFHIVLHDLRMTIELDRDGFAAERPIVVARDLGRIRMMVENRTADAHVTRLRVSVRDRALGEAFPAGTGPPRAAYTVVQDGQRVGVVRVGEESEIALTVSGTVTVIELIRTGEGREEK